MRDHDTNPLDPDDDVDILTIPFEHVEKKLVPKHGWYNLYGLDPKAEEAAAASFVTAGLTGKSGKRKVRRLALTGTGWS